jgi:CheY-like chemotaxis protein
MLRVLVVDDNRDTAETTGILLGFWGHEVHAAHDGATAVQAAGRFRPDVVLLDIGLPDMEGYEVARQILRQPGKQPVIICISGYGREEDRRKSREAGCDHHFLKPLGPGELQRLLQSVQDTPPPTA